MRELYVGNVDECQHVPRFRQRVNDEFALVRHLRLLKRLLTYLVTASSLAAGSIIAQETRATEAPHLSTHVYAVTRPTLITSIALTQSEADSSADANEALSDYQYYLSLAVPVLRKYGVEVHSTNDATIRWRDRLGVHSASAADSGGVLYLFVLPDGRKRILPQGVEIDEAILAAAREQFGLPTPMPKGEPDEP